MVSINMYKLIPLIGIMCPYTTPSYYIDFILLYFFLFDFSLLLFIIAQFFKMPKVFFCSNCSLQHARPVEKKCQQMPGESFSSEVDAPAPPSSSSLPPSVTDQILFRTTTGDKMEQMDRRVQRTEVALEQGSAQASNSTSSTASHSNNLVGGSTTEQATVESVVLSIDYLRTNDLLQSEVERRLAELRNINEFAT